MTGKPADLERKFSGLSCFAGRKSRAAVFLVLFLLGYNLTLSEIQQCSATNGTVPPTPQGPPPASSLPQQTVLPPGGGPNPPPTPISDPSAPQPPAPGSCQGTPTDGCNDSPCEITGTAITVAIDLFNDYFQDLSNAARAIESWLYTYVPPIVQSEFYQINWMELSMIDWWNTMWYYNLLPSYQLMTKQLDVELALQTQQLQENADASAIQETDRALAKHAIDDQEMQPAEQVCVAATESGGFTRVMSFERPVRQAWEMKSLAAGLNTTVDPDGNAYPGATSAEGSDRQRYQDWQNIFCDPNGNSTSNVHCGNNIDTTLTNADVLPVRYLFNNLTIQVDNTAAAPNGNTEGQNLELAIEYLINNLVGLPAMDAVPAGALTPSGGEATYLDRRSYLARYAVVRSVPDMVAGWRMPGSTPNSSSATSCAQATGIAQFVCDLRESAEVPVGTASGNLGDHTSKNPSYKEIMHALSVDRFNSGFYATNMITDPAKVDLEKLDISVLYLMQLRDYYELLERTALTLAVQVSVLTEQQTGSGVNAAAPTGGPAPPGG